MKPALIGLALMAAATAFAADTKQAPKFTKIEFFGLNCTLCEDGLKDKFEALPGVKKAQVDMASFTVCVATKPGQDLKPNEIRETLSAVGFNTVKVEPVAKC
jgi:cation transport ATPase